MQIYYQEHLIGNPDLFIHIEQYDRVRKSSKKTHTPVVAGGAAHFLMPVDVLF